MNPRPSRHRDADARRIWRQESIDRLRKQATERARIIEMAARQSGTKTNDTTPNDAA